MNNNINIEESSNDKLWDQFVLKSNDKLWDQFVLKSYNKKFYSFSEI